VLGLPHTRQGTDPTCPLHCRLTQPLAAVLVGWLFHLWGRPSAVLLQSIVSRLSVHQYLKANLTVRLHFVKPNGQRYGFTNTTRPVTVVAGIGDLAAPRQALDSLVAAVSDMTANLSQDGSSAELRAGVWARLDLCSL